MDGIKGLFDSKKAFFTLLFFLACCAGWLTGKMTTDQWAQFSLIALGGYFTAETVNAVAGPRDKTTIRTVSVSSDPPGNLAESIKTTSTTPEVSQ